MNRAVVSAVSVLSLAGCENPTDASENKLPYQSRVEAVEEVATEVSETGCDCLTVGRWYRFDTLALTSIDKGDHPVMATLNGLWEADIAGNELNILMEISAVSATEVKAKIRNGARIDESPNICAIASSTIDVTFPRTGCRLDASSESAFNVYAGTETFPKNCSTTLPVKHAIPVSRAQLEGVISEDCGSIIAGKVPAGGLGQAELGQTCTCLVLPGAPASDCGALEPDFADTACVGCNSKYQPLSQLLQAFGEVKWLCQTDSGQPAACLTADFTAVALPAAMPACASRE
jgi:hypothetical protein